MRQMGAFHTIEEEATSSSDAGVKNEGKRAMQFNADDISSVAPGSMTERLQQKPHTEEDKIRERQAQMMVCDL